MKQFTVEVAVRFTSEIFHYWPNAPGRTKYLASKHRHLLHVEAAVEVEHNDREIEFHDLLAFCRRAFPHGDVGTASCEELAITLACKLEQQYGERNITVSVFEDGEVGARVKCTQ